MTKCKFSESSVVVPSTCVIHVINGEQILNATCVCGPSMRVMSPLTKM